MIPPVVSRLALGALHRLDAETAHSVTIRALAAGLHPRLDNRRWPRLAQTVLGLDVPNPLGMAAGFDKNGEVPDAVLGLGFGFAEVGTVTPLPQPGNPRPRLFRLPADQGVINRFGFNNEGHAALLARLEARRGRGGVVGVNVGANKDATDRVADYVAGIRTFAHLASYFTVNVSSPNTPGLRDLQAREALDGLLAAVMAERDASAARTGRSVPVLLKIAPDVSPEGLEDIAEAVSTHRVDGLIVSNTTLSRSGLQDRQTAAETGGLSGRPLFRRATIILARVRQLVGPDLPIIGVGGIDSPESAVAKLAAGATLLQVYSALTYKGPELVRAILEHLEAEMARRGLSRLAELSASEVDVWARQPLD
ncbi:quinone-dependent dihydroorotate dehydrogenase [Microvirga tunisiensis]|uniref:Dihydroorotate dehydrogenase (quinone) n=1 Tax=Pannonibacter tanglangensis TaxID=2750084 RepID=A0A7X5J9E2_9HYPH|nr:quinone-dependent dihydroorotate dehydrogenase [Pannonibacter sp. XCT-53]NBN78822.1 quinone-dependent dihydroorotate dehydrogenase [Pannonibacter sp. XCT-53]